MRRCKPHRSRLGSVAGSGILFLAVSSAAAFQGFDPNGQGSIYPRQANGRDTTLPSIHAVRIDGEPVNVDGKLTEPVWVNAEAGTGFSMHEPDRGGAPTEQTVFKVAYDDDAVYFAVACYEKDPAKVRSTLSRRDRISESDLVSVYVDPYLDHTTGYNFRVNPHGVQMDQYVFNDGDTDEDWDAVWQAETSANAEGWYVEMRIPFSSIRYRPAESMTWGLQVYRWMHGRGEDTGWVTWERETRGFVSRFGTVAGLSGVHAPRQLEVLPYFVTRSTDPSAPGNDSVDRYGNIGADVKYGVTAALTLNATIQPDFGQVEADPALLNLSPFETFYEEKRPFFIEGSRFFQHPDFNLFYSRRIGTEDPNGNSRIRGAGKLTGKAAGGVSVAALVATTDITGEGQGHNLFRSGTERSNYFVGRCGKDFAGGAHRVHLMQTAAVRPGGERQNAYTSGMDFDLNFADRRYNVQGSVVGSIVQPGTVGAAVPSIYGTGGALDLRKLDGNWRGGVFGRWEGDKLRLNDLGFLSAPDEVNGGFWGQRRLNGDGKTSRLNQGSINLNYYTSALYAGRSGFDPAGNLLWSYARGHHQGTSGNINSWWQYRNYWSNWWGVYVEAEGTSRYETRGGPLMSRPAAMGAWVGGETDGRKRFALDGELEWDASEAGNRSGEMNLGLRWNQSTSVNHRLRFGYEDAHRDAQYVTTFVHLDGQGAVDLGRGFGGSSYVFGELDTRTFDVTLRTDVLFTRKQSLELYLQPFVSVGTYANARELATADSYDLRTFAASGFDVQQSDFNTTSWNMNLVYRWEYRPGSALFLVWTQTRNTDASRSSMGDAFNDHFEPGSVLDNEPENVFLAKLTYWFSI